MKLKKMISIICSLALSVSMLSACSSDDSSTKSGSSAPVSDSQTSSENSEATSSEEDKEMANTYALTSENVKLVGRTWLNEDALWLALSGSGIDFEYTGKKLDITVLGDGAASGGIDNQARIAFYVDGERVVDEMVNSPEETFTVFESAEAKTVNVKVIKLSECAMSTCGIKAITVAEGETIKPAAAKSHTIEFIGDSITCGYGVDDEVKEHHFSTSTEDVTKAYAYKTAQALDADYSMFSISGYGIISGYTTGSTPVKEQTIPQYYESLGFSYNSFANTTKPHTLEWDFESFKPEVIVINLGTNDASYTNILKERKQEYADGYKAFLKQVRENNPDATIFCTLGTMDNRLCEKLMETVIEYTTETGDENVHYMMFDLQDGANDGYAADWHPTEATHQKAADKLVNEIKTVMGW